MTLLRRLAPGVPWIPWLPVAGLVGLLAWAITDRPDFASRHLYLRAGLLLAALGLSFAFDDPVAPTTDSVPSPLRLRRLLRAVLSLVPWSLCIAVLVWAGSRDGVDPVLILSSTADRPQLPVGRLILEAGTMAAWGLALASVFAKRWDEEPGKLASVALLAMYAVSWLVPERWTLWALPNGAQWKASHPWWWVAIGLGAMIVTVASWDSRRQRPALRPGKTRRRVGEEGVTKTPQSGACRAPQTERLGADLDHSPK